MSPKISVIVPVYNAEKTLHDCIDGILNQEFKDFELILVDDGSQDSSPYICDEYKLKDSRVIVIHQQNNGASTARNAALDIARGEWVTFIDSDDLIEPNFLYDYSTCDATLLVTGMKSFRKDINNLYTIYGYDHQYSLEGETLTNLLNQSISDLVFRVPWGKYYRRDVIGNLRFHTEMYVAEDACFVMEYLASVKKISFIPYGSYRVRLSDLPADLKYEVTVNHAIKSLNNLHKAYIELENRFHISHHGFFSFIGSFKSMSRKEWKQQPSIWYMNKAIRPFYRYIWPSLTWKERLQLVGAFLLRR